MTGNTTWEPLEEGTHELSDRDMVEPHNGAWLSVGVREKDSEEWTFVEVRLGDDIRLCRKVEAQPVPDSVKFFWVKEPSE